MEEGDLDICEEGVHDLRQFYCMYGGTRMGDNCSQSHVLYLTS